MTFHREADTQLSSDTDLEDLEGRNAKLGKAKVNHLAFKPSCF